MNENRYSNDQQYGNGFNENQQTRIPENLMEYMPEQMRDRIEDVMAEAENRSPYENIEAQKPIQMNPTLAITALAIGFGGVFVFGKINPMLALFCFGVMIVIFGIGIVTDKNFSFQKQAMSTIILVIGIITVLVTLYLMLLKNNPSLPRPEGQGLKILIGAGFALFAALVLILNCISSRYYKNACTEQVSAVCVYLKEKIEHNSRTTTHTIYAPVFEFQFRGNTYCVAEKYGNGNVPPVGSRRDIYINPFEPTEFYRKQSNVSLVIVCILFMAIGCAVCFIP